jgi:hypothetical protein
MQQEDENPVDESREEESSYEREKVSIHVIRITKEINVSYKSCPFYLVPFLTITTNELIDATEQGLVVLHMGSTTFCFLKKN